MSKQIFLNGYANRYDVLKFLQQSKYFVSTSKVETFGVVLIEAMSCGLPVLSTKSGGPESIIKNSMLGILCDLNDLEKEMLKIVKSNYNSDYIRKYIVDNFSEKIISKKLIQFILKSLINGKKIFLPHINSILFVFIFALISYRRSFVDLSFFILKRDCTFFFSIRFR